MSTVIEWLADSLITGSIVILIVWMVRAFIVQRAPRRYAYLLWVVVGIRLLLPVSIPSVFSVFNLAPEMNPVREYLVGEDSYEHGTATSASDKVLTSSSKNNEYSRKNVGTDTTIPHEITDERSPKEKYSGGHLSEDVSTKTQVRTVYHLDKEIWIYVLFYVWMTGVVVFFLKNLTDSVRLHRRLCTAVRREAGVFESDRIDTPFVRGIVKPRIYIPFRLSERELACILAHERHHIRRGDAAFKFLAMVLVAVYWFHPLVWLSYRFMVQDMEISCDEYVLEHENGDIRAEYSTLLLAFATNKRIADGVLFFGENDTRRRVKHIMMYKKSGIIAGVAALVAVCIVSVCCLTNAKGRESGTIDVVSGDSALGAESDGKDDTILSSDVVTLELPGSKNIQGELVEASTTGDTTWHIGGSDLIRLIYADRDQLILSGTLGLFVYDKNEQKMIRTVSYTAIGGVSNQSEEKNSVVASLDGSQVYLNPTAASKDMYIYDIKKDILVKVDISTFEQLNIAHSKAETDEMTYETDGKTINVRLRYDKCYGDYCYCEYADEDEPLMAQWHALFLDEKYRKAELLHLSDIQDVEKIEMFIGDSMKTIVDPDMLSEFENAINAYETPKRKDDFSACPFDKPMYLTMKDGTFGMIYPATDSCGAFISAEGECEAVSDGDSSRFNLCNLLQWPYGGTLELTEGQ
ncbi:MAG: hypothetical protein K6G65_02060 [Lachnospiraceae bacterium]|nr:hypothetical protein [Lachnospiraceae bacterium]